MSSYGQANIGGGGGDYRLIILIIIIIRCSILLNNQTYTHAQKNLHNADFNPEFV